MSGPSADIIVLGGGGAALSAAAEAARLGRRVILIEKNRAVGGTTALSVGSIMAACVRSQGDANAADSPRRHADEIAAIAASLGLTDNPELRRVLTEHSGETVDFLASIGVDFIGPLPQPPFPTDRFYAALPGGRVYVLRLLRHCRRLGVEIRTATRARRLVRQEGRVTGVEVERADGGVEILTAGAGIILATGDFSANREMRAALLGPGLEAVEPINPAATGDGQRMAVEIGARLVPRPDIPPAGMAQARFTVPPAQGFVARLPPYRLVTKAMRLAYALLPDRLLRPILLRAAMTWLSPERSLYEHGAILVNRRGDRFTDEAKAQAAEIAGQEGGDAFIILDGRIAQTFSAWPHFVSTAPGVAFAYIEDYRTVRGDIFHEAPTIDALAGRIGLPAAALAATVQARGSTPESGRPLDQSPFIALGPLRAWLPLTPVGIAVNARLQALDVEGKPIPGLYAAGNAGQGGLSSLFHGHSLGWAFTSGRLAGRYAAFDG